MPIDIRAVGPDQLCEYGRVPSLFVVREALRVEAVDGGLGGLRLVCEPVTPAWTKDYDAEGRALPEPEIPETWPARFDVSGWAFLVAYDGSQPVAAAAVAMDSPALLSFGERRDTAILWDIRVHPDWQRRGLGAAVFRRAASVARERGCTRLKVETQNTNVRACRFYAAMGCQLAAIHRHAYSATNPDEAMLLWYLDL